jgi:Fe-S-cluster containining protein
MSGAAPRSPDDDPHWRRLYESTRTAAVADAQRRLADGPSQSLAHDLVAEAIARMEQVIASDANPPARACKRGCSWCCRQPVFLTAPEAVAVVAHLRATWNNDQLAALRSDLAMRIAEHRTLRGGGQGSEAVEELAMRIAEHRTLREDRRLLTAGLPCVFLDEDNACTIHGVRPLICRGFMSSSAEACAERYIDPVNAPPPPVDVHAYTAARGVLHGLSAALTDAGMAGGMGELNVLLAQLLSPAQDHTTA